MSTLAKVKKGETVMLCVFTGMKIGPKEVTACDKSTITIHHKKKGDMTFERETGKLIKPLPENPRFSSFIEEDDGTFVRPTRKGSKNKDVKEDSVKKTKKKKKTESEEVEEDKTPVKKAKKTTKKSIPKIEEIKEDEDDEDWDDDVEEDEE